MARAILVVTGLLVGGLVGHAQSDVQFAGDKCVLVDGKPFFPIGLYSAGGTADFPAIAEAGFNTVHSYAWEGKRHNDAGKAWLDAAEANGLRALVGLYRPDVKARDFAASLERLTEYKDHPALLAWHTMDEPAWDKDGDAGRDYMPHAYAIVKQHDPAHPVTAVTCHFGDMKLFENAVDVMQADYYPIPPIPSEWYSGTGFRGIKQFVDKWREASGGKKPFWYVGQIFDFSVSKEKTHEVPDEWRRLPTGDELRCMTYTAVASGARGIFYWSLSRLIGDEWNRTLLGRVKLWEELKGVTGELNQLMPLLTADTPETIQEGNGVVAMIKGDGTATHILAVNYERRATETTVEVPGVGEGAAHRLFAEGAEPIADGRLALRFAPLEVKVFRVEADRP